MKRESKSHLKTVVELPCLLTGDTYRVQAHHLLLQDYEDIPEEDRHATGSKTGDDCAIPLNFMIHDHIHKTGIERAFLREYGVEDPLEVARFIYLCLHKWEAEDYIINSFSYLWEPNRYKLEKLFQPKSNKTIKPEIWSK